MSKVTKITKQIETPTPVMEPIVEEPKKKRKYTMTEEDREKRREVGKKLALKKAEKIKEEKEKKKQQVTYKDYVSIINELAPESSEDEKESDEEVPIPMPPTTKSKKAIVIPKAKKETITENITVITPPVKEEEKPKVKSYADIMREFMTKK